jgi:hypothetical protein
MDHFGPFWSKKMDVANRSSGLILTCQWHNVINNSWLPKHQHELFYPEHPWTNMWFQLMSSIFQLCHAISALFNGFILGPKNAAATSSQLSQLALFIHNLAWHHAWNQPVWAIVFFRPISGLTLAWNHTWRPKIKVGLRKSSENHPELRFHVEFRAFKCVKSYC